MTAVRYRLGRVARETAPDGVVWVAAIPHGPISALDGVGPLVLDVLDEADGPLGADEVTAVLLEHLEGMPDGAGELVAGFLAQLAELGVVEAVVP